MTTPEAQAQTLTPPTGAGIAPMTQAGADATATAPTATVPEQRTTPETVPTTPGGVPGIPLLTIGATSTVTAVSLGGLTAGPLGAILVGGGLAATAAVTAVARAERTPAKSSSGTRSKGTNRASGAGRTTGGRHAAGSGRLGAFRPGRLGGGRSAGGATGGRRGSSAGLRSGAASGIRAAQKRAGQLRSSRAAAAASPMSRRQKREQLTADRRRVADARRNARAQARADRKASAGSGRTPAAHKAVAGGSTGRGRGFASRAGRTLAAMRPGRSGGAGRSGGGVNLRKGRGGSAGTAGGSSSRPRVGRIQARRQARDEARNRRVAAERAHVEKRARERARKSALRRSAARFQARRIAAGLLATPLGLLSLLMWLPAKFLRLRPPQWGRRLYRHLVLAATDARVRRDVAAYDQHDQEQAEAEANNLKRLPDVEEADDSATAPTTTTSTTTTEEMNPMAFDFRAAAEEMLRQAQTAEPGGMMNVLAAFQTLPEAIGMIAETFGVVAGRASEDMPLEPPVAEALMDLHKQLIACVETASEVSTVFETTHEADIRRHTEPRPGEEQWDTSANQE
ncbi:hypothetical protein [Streptomyces sp. G45]|uniref:hypothetical protein n=1 Tax=Streptomyces sp. G45 TaxID=3406627 RepID=UPI003C142AA2